MLKLHRQLNQLKIIHQEVRMIKHKFDIVYNKLRNFVKSQTRASGDSQDRNIIDSGLNGS